MKTIWKGNYLNNTLEVQSSWFGGKVLLNEDEIEVNHGWFGKSNFECKLPNSDRTARFKMKLKAGIWKVKCFVFADGKEVKMIEIKK